jgi:cobalt/nickel transport system ATP-binding protein
MANGYGLRVGNVKGRLIVIPHTAKIPDMDVDFIAVMGTKAKERAFKEGLEADIVNAVLDRSILRAIEGHTVLMICSAEMIDVVRREVKRFPVVLEVLDSEISKNLSEEVVEWSS